MGFDGCWHHWNNQDQHRHLLSLRAQLFDLIALGDWTSCYLALDNDVDPGPIDAITQLKSSLAG